MSLANKTVINVLWSFLEQILRKGTSVITTLVLAWFLTPNDYGLVAIMSVFLAFLFALIEGGLKTAIIKKQNITSEELNSVFKLNMLLSIIAYVLIFSLAPNIANYYEAPDLKALLQLSAVSLIFNAMSFVPSAILQKELQFKKLMLTSLPAAVISGMLAMALAFLEYGVWAIAWQMVAFAFFNTLLLLLLKIWRPRVDFKIDIKLLYPLLSFSGYVFGGGIIREAVYKSYILIIGKVFSLSIAGWYFFAEKIKEIIFQQLISSVQQVTFPALSQVQNDPERLKKGYRKVLLISSFIVFPILIGVTSTSELIFKLILPEKWLPSVIYLQLMLLFSLTGPILRLSDHILFIKDSARQFFILSILESVLILTALISTYSYGVKYVIIGNGLVLISMLIIKANLINKLINYSIFEQIKDLLPVLFISFLTGAIVYYLQEFLFVNTLITFIFVSCTGVFIYVLLSYVFNKTTLMLFLGLIRKKEKTSC